LLEGGCSSFSLLDSQEVETLFEWPVAAMDCSGAPPVFSDLVVPSGPVRREESITLGDLLEEDIVEASRGK
jgi:hypothetical protein